MELCHKDMIVSLKSEMGNRFPNTFIVGVPKSGTTSLFRYLDYSTDVFAPSVKEPSFFSDLEKASSKINWFSKLYNNADEQIRLNSTSINFYGSNILPSLLKEIDPNIKIIILLRDPVDRFYSFFRFLKHMNYTRADERIEEFLDSILSDVEKDMTLNNNDFHIEGEKYKESTLIGGNYAEHLSKWVNHFNGNLMIGFFDDLKTRPREFMGELSTYLNIENVWDSFKFEVENQTITPKNKLIHNLLISLYSNFGASLNKNKYLKRTLLNLYKSLNASNTKKKSNEKVDLLLKDYYQKDIIDTRELILQHSNLCFGLPSWLSPVDSQSLMK